MSVQTHELAWAAGFFDGEGSCCFVPKSGGLQMSVTQAGESALFALERFKTAVLGIGYVRNRKAPKNATKPVYQWEVSSFEGVQAVVALLWKFLSPIGRKKALRAFGFLYDAGYCQPRLTCRNGLHPRTPENIYQAPNGSRACRPCRTANDRRHDAKIRVQRLQEVV